MSIAAIALELVYFMSFVTTDDRLEYPDVQLRTHAVCHDDQEAGVQQPESGGSGRRRHVDRGPLLSPSDLFLKPEVLTHAAGLISAATSMRWLVMRRVCCVRRYRRRCRR
ncbi:hypothetical protein PI124_g20809 [Phytophthora idaei]|nr:hypothetical protein PI126_g20539 [Phytophthora idaei]KAG3234131.1 hypothetical protein PI124_g20809 [Phytophthora idaei]